MKILAEHVSDELVYRHAVTPIGPVTRFSLHTHEYPELILFVRGCAHHVVEDRRYALRRHDLVLVRPTVPHYIALEGSEEYERCDLLFHPRFLEGLDCRELLAHTDVVACADNALILDSFRRLDYYSRVFGKAAFPDLARGVVREMFYNLSLPGRTPPTEQAALHPILQQALRYIGENLAAISSVTEISDALHITDRYLYRLFRQQLKTSPKKYLTNRRLLAAQAQLCLGRRPTEVHAALGFPEYSTFFRLYRARFGYAPSEENRVRAHTEPS